MFDHVVGGQNMCSLPMAIVSHAVQILDGTRWRHLQSCKIHPPTPSLSNLLPAKSSFEQQRIPRRQRFHGHICTVFITSRKEFPCPKAENYFQAWLSAMKAKYVCASVGSLCVCLCVLGGGVCWLQWGGSICVHIWMAGLVLENTWPVTFNEKPMEWR